MNGVHDLGGADGFGRVEVEPNEPVFHQAWERRLFGVVAALSVRRLFRTDTYRHAIERMDPVHYLSSAYYEHWLTGLATLLVEHGTTTLADLETKAGGRFPLSQSLHPSVAPSSTPSGSQPRFVVGDTVVVRTIHPFGHTRCPRYVRGKRGVVTRIDAPTSLPDVAAHSPERCAQYTYNVRFAGRELWGQEACPKSAVHIDLWEAYLEAT